MFIEYDFQMVKHIWNELGKLVTKCVGIFLCIIGQDHVVSKSNRLHVDIFQVF